MTYILPLEQLQLQVRNNPATPWLHQPVNRVWRTWTWAQAYDEARQVAAGLRAAYAPGTRIAIISKNCAHWVLADFGIMLAGMVSVPIYPTAGEDTISYVLEHSGAEAIFIGKLDGMSAVDNAVPDSVAKIAFPYQSVAGAQSWDEWLAGFEPLDDIAKPAPEDTLTIPYTSGSTGRPKGVVISHRNLAASAWHTWQVLGGGTDEKMLSYLPLAHITERAVVEIVSLYARSQMFFNESLETFADDLRYVRPTGFVSVPRLWSRLQSQVLLAIPDKKLQRLLAIPIVGKVVAHRIRKKLGFDKAERFGSGTAPISPSVLQWFLRLGIPIGEGWGMTETAGLSCGNVPFDAGHIGTIGRPVPCVEMRLSDAGEVLIRGDAIFSQYYKNPEASAESFTDGWFHTGDIAEVDEDGVYRIIGRVKEQFKTGKGKYVAPVPIESMLAGDANIEQVCVMGSGRKQPVALVVLNITDGVVDEAMRAELTELCDAINRKLESHQRLDHLIVCSEVWDISNDMLTPTLKLKRDKLEGHYNELLEHPGLNKQVVWESELG